MSKRRPNSQFLQNHFSHDYRLLVRRWRAVAKTAKLQMRSFCEAGGYPVYFLQTKKFPQRGGIYISAGIHGDEPGATEALITWAEANLQNLANGDFLIFPCLNPWGLIHNNRLDSEGRDLNRLFHHDEIGMIHSLKTTIRDCCFAIALTLHEDYDGQGFYLYEIAKAAKASKFAKDDPYFGEELLKIVASILPVDSRPKIDGRKLTKPGLFRRRLNRKVFEKMGFPEAVWLHLHHAAHTLTFETPSEFSLEQRVKAQVALINHCVKRQRKSA